MGEVIDRLTAALADRYAIERELGSGGMATVYLARDLRHERQVAVKVLRPDLAATLGSERFHREIKIAAQLQHPNILPLHDSGEADGFLFYVMPYVEGQSLRERLAREGALPIGDAVRIVRDVVDALTEAHAHGVVHRDIKPENILLRGQHALVTDFGVAKAVSEVTGQARLTTEGVALGTPMYMAPEQAAADPHLDHRVDIYAVGAVAYELLTGRPVFMGTTPQMVLSAHMTEAPDPVTKHRDTVPPVLEAVVMRCLEKRPADRWQSARELLPQLDVPATPSGGTTPVGTVPAVRVTWQRRLAVGVAAAVILAVAAIGIAMLFPRGGGDVLDANRVLVVAYTDESGMEQYRSLGHWAQDHVIDVLTEAGFAEVVDPLSTLAVTQNVAETASFGSGPDGPLALAHEAGAGTVVYGSYYAEGDSVRIHTRVADAHDGSVLGTVGPVVGTVGARGELVTRLGQQVAVKLAALLDRELGSWEPTVQPATYEAYEAYSEGLQAYLRSSTDPEAEHQFERALTIDPTFTRARLLAAQASLTSGSGNTDSLLAPLLASREALTRYERCRLDFVAAMPVLDLPTQYKAARCMAEAAPGSDDAKREAAVTALRVNRPREALALLRELDPDHGLMKQWGEYWWRVGTAYHALGEYERELEAAREGRRRYPESLVHAMLEVRALAALGRLGEVAAQTEAVRASPLQERLGEYLFWVSLFLRTHGHRAAAAEVDDEAIAWFRSRPLDTEESRAWLAKSLYLAGRWAESQQLFDELAGEHPDSLSYMGVRGWLAARRGDREEALRISENLCDQQRCTGWMMPGESAVYRAEIAALLGDRDTATLLLRQVFGITLLAHPRLGWPTSPHYHFAFESLRDYRPFQDLMRPRG